MKAVRVIAANTVVELLRNRLLYTLLVITIFLLALMVAVGQLSYTEQLRLTLGLGLSSIHMCLMGLTIFVGGSMVYKEIEKLTILTLLAKPVYRYEFILGKYFGFLCLMVLIISSLFVIYCLNLMFMGFEVPLAELFIVFFGFYLEVALLLAVTICFSTFCASFLTILFSLSFFIIGHWVQNLSFIGNFAAAKFYVNFAKVMQTVFPNLEAFNWRSLPLENNLLQLSIGSTYLMALTWVLFFLTAAIFIFKGRDFA